MALVDLNTRIREIITDDPATWEQAWTEGVTPWDKGVVQPPLEDLLASDTELLPHTGRALVPGCGRGRDVLAIAAALGLDALGLDVSPTAIAAANELLARTRVPPQGTASFVAGDFFALAPAPQERFALVYDYTFFVAFPQSRRAAWGAQMRRLVAPGGVLVALAYPLGEREGGPPHTLQVEDYPAALGVGWTLVLDRVPERSLPGREGKERLLVWRRQRGEEE